MGRKMENRNFKAAVFDLDGTLLDTLEDLADSVNAVLERHGWATHPVEAYRYFVGDGPTVLFERALPGEIATDADAVAPLVSEYKVEYDSRWDAKSRPYAGIPELLDGLAAQGLKLSVLSNKPHEFTLKCVEGLLGKWEWDVLLGLRDGEPKKPHPKGGLEVAERLGVEPRECVYFGDTSTDMKTAIAAGMYPVGVLWGFREEEELRESGAGLLLKRPGDFFTRSSTLRSRRG